MWILQVCRRCVAPPRSAIAETMLHLHMSPYLLVEIVVCGEAWTEKSLTGAT